MATSVQGMPDLNGNCHLFLNAASIPKEGQDGFRKNTILVFGRRHVFPDEHDFLVGIAYGGKRGFLLPFLAGLA